MTTTPAAEPRQDRLSDKIGRFVAIPHTFIKDMRNLPQCAIVLFVYLRSCANKDTGDAFPAYETIEQDTGITRHTISKAIKALEQRGWITKKRRFSNSTIYELCDPSISAKNALMDGETEPPLVQKMHSISAENALPLVQKMHPNKTKRTRLKEQQQEAPQVEVAADADFYLSIWNELKTHGITRNKKTSEIVKRFAGCEHALDIIRAEAKNIGNDKKNKAGVLVDVLANYDIATYTPAGKNSYRLIDEY